MVTQAQELTSVQHSSQKNSTNNFTWIEPKEVDFLHEKDRGLDDFKDMDGYAPGCKSLANNEAIYLTLDF